MRRASDESEKRGQEVRRERTVRLMTVRSSSNASKASSWLMMVPVGPYMV